MNKEVIEVQVRAVVPLDASFAVFLGNADKTFVIYVDESVGTAISMFMRGVAKERPLTHDLMASLLMAFGAKVDRIVINDLSGSVFRARLIIVAENELHARKVIEIDARPSDSIAMATQSGAPVFVARQVWESVEDMTEALEEIEKRGNALASEAKGAAPSGAGDEIEDEEGDDDEDFDLEDENDDDDEEDDSSPSR
ncbi:MAG: bifunctional nuclease family protein [Verrucomicrobiaceae bacterium]|nr:bifunctional nuclease family protein [Verrucomicrobiaceae bacterium]